ncbi:hypothetical protein BDF21DRAFT_437561 [Thamnidium elegans]|uniref:C2H2-type domain-containing protein n=1 Tax=Thamnidium elegans TaxID=101142 RepID=A0A8H7SY10_9FUNG|nr:hypothetical protein INT48_001386 [Thamnidium elegans]KAI8085248.1 hypothetical protein BDF21DRAFT_437561 [Thamnidium elegans]
MPFRCKCGRTFEKTDSFASHTSACAPFHHRRMSDTTQLSTTPQQPFINTSFSSFLSSSSPQATSPSDSIITMDSGTRDLSSSVPNNNTGFFMPTALSLQNAFEGARRRSMSYGSSLK